MAIAVHATGLVLDLPLVLNPSAELSEEWRNLESLESPSCSRGAVLTLPFPAPARQLCQFVPPDVSNFFPGLRLEWKVHRHVGTNEEHDFLATYLQLELLQFAMLWYESVQLRVEAGLLVCLSHSTGQILFALVHLPPWEHPRSPFVPASYQYNRVHGVVQQDEA